MSMSQVIQRQSIHYSGALPVLRLLLSQVSGNVEMLEEKKMRVFQNVDVTLENKIIMIEVYIMFSFQVLHFRVLSVCVTVPAVDA